LPRRSQHSRQEEIPLAEPSPPWKAKGIFTEHIIRAKLPDSRLWPAPEAAEAIRLFCLDLWTRKHVWLASKGKESHTRQELLDPILQRLGFAFLSATDLPSSVARREPDYLLYPDEQAKASVFSGASVDPYRPAIALLEAKKVNHPLDAVSKRETPGRFPHQQVREYLQYALDVARKPYFNWAILANGTVWRLYCRDATPDDYFELDFEKSLESPEVFAVFVALFGPGAFAVDSEGRCALDELREDALERQTELEDDLRDRVFTILESLANGFYSRPENYITGEQLGDLYKNCLILLYRLLFVLYAEGRGLLPVHRFGAGSRLHYRERFSLARLLPKLRDPARFYPEDTFTKLYEDLLDLFKLINGDDPALNRKCNVPQYNGGLFNSRTYPKLQQWRVGEKALALALQGLMFGRAPARRGEPDRIDFGETIDYTELEVRQLGTIYEGLLENHLEQKDGRLVLVGDKAERRATGTYYTPDYVVRYIVEHTMGPLCQRAEESAPVRAAMSQNKRDNSFANAVLRYRVLDPAMGSGHFLVRATEYLAERILDHPTTDIPLPEVPRGLSQVAAVRAYWRRQVVERCIFGVDLNRLAVELSKLSLWLTCIATNQPLSFLDHHLRPGNSLIGAKLGDLGSLPRREAEPVLDAWAAPDLKSAVSEALAALKIIEDTESKDIKALKEKEAHWTSDVLRRLAPYRSVADLWLSASFGQQVDDAQYSRLASFLVARKKHQTRYTKSAVSLLRATNRLQEAFAFFHWELEFPEVFFEADGKPKSAPGFDAVIGNPPYGAELSETELTFLRRRLGTGARSLDSYELFVAHGAGLLRESGLVSMIIPASWLTGDRYEHSRRKLVTEYSPLVAYVLPFDVFEAAYIDTAVVVFEDAKDVEHCLIHFFPKKARLSAIPDGVGSVVPVSNIRSDPHVRLTTLLSADTVPLLRRLAKAKAKFGDWFTIQRGVQPYSRAKHSAEQIASRFLHATERKSQEYLPELQGSELSRYSIASKRKSYLKYCDEIASTRPLEMFKGTRIVLRRLLTRKFRLQASLTADTMITTDNVLNMVPKSPKVDAALALGLLNSRLLSWLYVNTSMVAQKDDFPQVHISALEALPAAKGIGGLNAKLVELTQRMLKLHADLQGAWVDNEKDAIRRDIEATDRGIDALVYQLYGLTDAEIAIVEGRTS